MFTTKTFGKIIWMASILLVSVQLNAQDKNKKVSFEVKGNCGMCKARIEKAALKVKGVKYVNWDIPSKKITLILDENKCSPMDVRKAIALKGHDTDSTKADIKTYNNLPACCKYRDPNSIHMDHGTKH
ncbi:heavy-metal-associated domain-containing protein [Arenibacter aquaticus]